MRVCQFRHFGTSHQEKRLANPRSPAAVRIFSLSNTAVSCQCDASASTYTVVEAANGSPTRRQRRDMQTMAEAETGSNSRERFATCRGHSRTTGGGDPSSLAHDLSNALEIVVQTSYLLGTVGSLKEPGSRMAADARWWGREGARYQRQAPSDYVKDHSGPLRPCSA